MISNFSPYFPLLNYCANPSNELGFLDMKLTIADIFEKYKQLEGNEPDLYALVAKSVQICMKAIQLYGIEHIAVSYNGGKEADAVLYVFLLAIYASVDDPSSFDTGAGPFVNIIFFRRKEEFPDVIDHVNDVLTLYSVSLVLDFFSPSLRLLESPTEDFKLGMKYMVEAKGVRAVIMGNRLTDPYSCMCCRFGPICSYARLLHPQLRVLAGLHARVPRPPLVLWRCLAVYPRL